MLLILTNYNDGTEQINIRLIYVKIGIQIVIV
jgi:hypothetical protein